MSKPKFMFSRAVIFLFLLAIACVSLYPIFYMAINSVRTSVDFFKNPSGLPGTWYGLNYEALYYRFDVLRLFGNTLFCVLAAFSLNIFFTIPASYAFSKIEFRYRSALFLLVISTMTIPSITFIIPNFQIMARLGLVDHLVSVVLMWAITSIPTNIFLLTSLMRGIPNEVLAAAKIDGANYFQTLLRVVMPLSISGIITLAIFNTTDWWNDLFTPLIFLQSDELKTMTLAVATILKRFDTNQPLLLAGLLMTSIPPILIYMTLQRYIRKGLVVGSVK
ncbi:ABC transporter permease [Paenibacillus baekrokdamisoli]|uniref:ABC transporter permease n=1 Tax=Paenibacillus baekrokdamisoli TaxID=1712516 RepID=A0A3G9JGW4_9BACL|nr:carbohydrate ABC transporter permease [Paenibacillus baekrokdamisoli]MBB3072604.1 ABC-type glycerol-3-phosphate transport system permease component [Paenibacillus baekrokdamisoli]BBH22344.1 ABC transporter permease [Paenibacillus baekrokdamisoli]